MILPLIWALASAPAWAQDTPSDAEWAAAFAEYDQAMAMGNSARAADTLILLLDDPESEIFHGEALASLGKLLIQLELQYGALAALSQSLAVSDTAPTDAVSLALDMADEVGDPGLLEPVFGQNAGLGSTVEERSRIAWLAAKQNYRGQHFGVTLGVLNMVSAESPYYADAQHLKGIVFSQQGRFEAALEPLEIAVGHAEDPELLDLAHVNLARAFYGAGNYARAIENFAKVGRQSPHWLEAQFERAWAHFRLEDMNGALGILHTQVSPWFEEVYHPEAWLLRTYGLVLICKFPEANTQINAFHDHYGPLSDQLAAVLPNSDAQSVFDQLRRMTEGQTGVIPEVVLEPYLSEPRFLDSLAAVKRAEDELARLRNIPSNPFTERVNVWVRDRRGQLIQDEGDRILAQLRYQQDHLTQMLSDAQISRLDILRLETRLYETASLEGEMEEARRMANRGARVPRNWVSWPYEGEYWADELGYYQANAVPECPASLRMDVDDGS